MANREKNSETVNSVEKALDIITFLYNEEIEVGVVEIANRLNMPQSTVHRAMSTLVKKGFTYQNPDNNKYGLGVKLYQIGMVAGNSLKWVNQFEPYIKEIAEEFGETVNLAIMDKEEKAYPSSILVLQKTVRGRVLGTSQTVGVSTLCHLSAGGKALLAFSEKNWEREIRNLEFVEYTPTSIKSADELLTELKLIREKGYALDNEEQEEGLLCVACPITKANGEAIAAISISGPKDRIYARGIDRLSDCLKQKCKEVSKLVR